MINGNNHSIDRLVSRASNERFINLAVTNSHNLDPLIVVDGHEMTSFAFCNYLGLNHDERVKVNAIEKLLQHGTFCSSSRTFLHLQLLEQAEEKVGRIFEKPVVIVPKTTLGHFAAMPVMINSKDAIILDQQVHATVRQAAQTMQAVGVPVTTIRHSRMDMLESRIKELKDTTRHIWYMVDGVFSMFGDDIPVSDLLQLMDRYEQLHLYVDDAHGMSWDGKHGRGRLLAQMDYHPRLFMLTSLNKAFGADGGVIVCPDTATRDRIVNGGNTVIFTGPISPPALGAVMASADIHLSEEIICLQAQLQTRVQMFNDLATELELPLIVESDTPIFYIGVGKPEIGFEVCRRMMEKGYYLGLALYPAVSLNNTGLRATLTVRHQLSDIKDMLQTLSRVLQEVLEKHQIDMGQIYRYFRMQQKQLIT